MSDPFDDLWDDSFDDLWEDAPEPPTALLRNDLTGGSPPPAPPRSIARLPAESPRELMRARHDVTPGDVRNAEAVDVTQQERERVRQSDRDQLRRAVTPRSRGAVLDALESLGVTHTPRPQGGVNAEGEVVAQMPPPQRGERDVEDTVGYRLEGMLGDMTGSHGPPAQERTAHDTFGAALAGIGSTPAAVIGAGIRSPRVAGALVPSLSAATEGLSRLPQDMRDALANILDENVQEMRSGNPGVAMLGQLGADTAAGAATMGAGTLGGIAGRHIAPLARAAGAGAQNVAEGVSGIFLDEYGRGGSEGLGERAVSAVTNPTTAGMLALGGLTGAGATRAGSARGLRAGQDSVNRDMARLSGYAADDATAASQQFTNIGRMRARLEAETPLSRSGGPQEVADALAGRTVVENPRTGYVQDGGMSPDSYLGRRGADTRAMAEGAGQEFTQATDDAAWRQGQAAQAAERVRNSGRDAYRSQLSDAAGVDRAASDVHARQVSGNAQTRQVQEDYANVAGWVDVHVRDLDHAMEIVSDLGVRPRDLPPAPAAIRESFERLGLEPPDALETYRRLRVPQQREQAQPRGGSLGTADTPLDVARSPAAPNQDIIGTRNQRPPPPPAPPPPGTRVLGMEDIAPEPPARRPEALGDTQRYETSAPTPPTYGQDFQGAFSETVPVGSHLRVGTPDWPGTQSYVDQRLRQPIVDPDAPTPTLPGAVRNQEVLQRANTQSRDILRHARTISAQEVAAKGFSVDRVRADLQRVILDLEATPEASFGNNPRLSSALRQQLGSLRDLQGNVSFEDAWRIRKTMDDAIYTAEGLATAPNTPVSQAGQTARRVMADELQASADRMGFGREWEQAMADYSVASTMLEGIRPAALGVANTDAFPFNMRLQAAVNRSNYGAVGINPNYQPTRMHRVARNLSEANLENWTPGQAVGTARTVFNPISNTLRRLMEEEEEQE